MAYILLGASVYIGLVIVLLSLFASASCADRLWERRRRANAEGPRFKRRA